MFVQSYKQKNEIANAEAYFKCALKMVVWSGSKKNIFSLLTIKLLYLRGKICI